MLIRAAFWIGLVAILAPHPAAEGGCIGRTSCSATANLVHGLSAVGLRSLARVREQIETAERDRR